MSVALWILQILLAVAFASHAYLMLRPSPERLRSGMSYVLELPAGMRLFAGIAEGLAGIALVVAPFIGTISWLAWLAAGGLVVLMVGAIVYHIGRREYPNVGLNAVLAAFAAVVAWGRFGPYHF